MNLKILIVALIFGSVYLTLGGCNGSVQFSENASGAPDKCYPEIRDSTFSLQDLQPDVELELVEYLNLEWGRIYGKTSVSSATIKYLGESKICGNRVRIWSYPCLDGRTCYATIQPWGNGYVKASTSKLLGDELRQELQQ